jgi:bacterioferritin
MGTKAKAIVKAKGLDVQELIKLLNKAFSDEWLAYYQYWIGAKIAVGIPRKEVTGELEEHAEDELKHAKMLAERIIELGGTPVLEPKEWYTLSTCGYAKPKDPDVRTLLEQNIKGEQCAIYVYDALLEFTNEKDPVTYDMILKIQTEEIEHEEDLQKLQRDIELFIKEKK